MQNKKRNITLIVVGSIILVITLFCLIYFCSPWNKDFFNKATKEFDIPGLDTKFCPQGMTYLDNSDEYIVGGYMTDNTPSRYYVVDPDGEVKYFTLTINGEDFVGHSGGITSYQDSIWIVSKDSEIGYCYHIYVSDVMAVANGGKVAVTGKFDTHNGADFVFNDNGTLWVGEFYKKGKYDTEESHFITTSSGEVNPAVVFGYTIDSSTDNGVKDNTPVMALSIRSLCQGIAVTEDGKFVLSTSYGLADSNLYMYDNVLAKSITETIKVGDTNVPLAILDDSVLLSTVNAPAMSEEIVIKDGKLYVLFESACNKYKLFNRVRVRNVYSLPLSVFDANK